MPLLAATLALGSPFVPLRTKGMDLVDPSGQVVALRGINTSSKSDSARPG